MLNPVFGQDSSNAVDLYIKNIDSVYLKDQPKAFVVLEAYLNEKGVQSFTVKELDDIYYALAKYSSRAFDFDNSKRYAKKGLKILDDNNIIKGKSGYYNLLGGVNYFDNKLDSAAYYFVQSLSAMKADGEIDKLPFINNNIAGIYSEQNSPQKALPYYRKAYEQLKINKRDANSKLLSPLAGNLAYTYYQLDSLEKAKILANEAIKWADYFNNFQGAAIAYNVKSVLAEKEMKQDSAYFYLIKAYTMANEQKSNYQIAFTATNLAELLSTTNPKEASKYGEIAYSINKDGKKGNMLYKNIRTLGTAYFNMGNYKKASEFQKEYIIYKDSLFKEDYNEKTIDVLEKYQASQKELKIAQQQTQIIKKENENKFITFFTIGLALLSLSLFFNFRQRQKTQKQKIIALENEKENIALRSLVTGEEKERSRIARELHDGLGGILAVSKMHASKLQKSSANTVEFSKLIQLLDTASKESRRISHNLLPENLMLKGLDFALRDFVDSIRESSLLDASYQSINLSDDLPQSLQLSVYRIVQELLNNIIKHSEATVALVQLQQERQKLLITVEDNGKGFSNQKTIEGIGIANIKSRLSLLKGKLEIDSNQTSGTSVYIELQLEK